MREQHAVILCRGKPEQPRIKRILLNPTANHNNPSISFYLFTRLSKLLTNIRSCTFMLLTFYPFLSVFKLNNYYCNFFFISTIFITTFAHRESLCCLQCITDNEKKTISPHCNIQEHFLIFSF